MLEDLQKYIDNNENYNYLKSYYSLSDSAERYGVTRYEIRHSNLLAWLLNNSSRYTINNLPIKKILKLINFEGEIQSIGKFRAEREKYNTDIFIKLKINKIDYIIIIENKIDAIISKDNEEENQLGRYKEIVESEEEISLDRLFCVFLYPNYIDKEELEIAKREGYILVSYQELYECLLDSLEKFADNYETKFIIMDYIHCLATPHSDEENGIIVTKEEQNALKELFENDKEFIEIINHIKYKKHDQYNELYANNKAIFLSMFRKYLMIKDRDKDISKKIERILDKKKYIFNDVSYESIWKVVQAMFYYLTNDKGYRMEDLSELNNLYGEESKLLVTYEELNNKVKYKSWYNEKNIANIDNKVYYVLTRWRYDEYEKLKDDIEKLKEVNKEVYGDLNLE